MALTKRQLSKLDKEYLGFAREILVQMKSVKVIEKAKLTPVLNRTFTEDGWSDQHETKRRFIVQYDDYQGLLTKPDVKKCITDHVRLGVLRKPEMSNAAGERIPNPTYEQYAAGIFYSGILGPIYLLLEKSKYDFTDRQILEAYRRYRKGWLTTHYRISSIIPLFRFDTPIKEANFGLIRLSRFGLKEKSAISGFATGLPSGQFPSNFELLGMKNKLGYTVRLPINEGYKQGDIGKSLRAMMTALRLTKEGHVGASNIFTGTNQAQSFDYGSARNMNLKNYRLERRDLPLCRQLFSAIFEESEGKLKELIVGLRRFNLSYARETAEDRIIDLTICLESCVLAGLKDELRYRLAVRGAILLRKIRPPKETSALLKKIYDARSEIVHEGRNLLDFTLSDQCEAVTREILAEYITRMMVGQTLKQINVTLDESAIT